MEDKGNVQASTRNQLAIVTGASSGIGYELAKQFAQNGFDLLIASAADRIYNVADELAEFGVKVDVCQVDLVEFEGVEELWEKARLMGRPIAACAINAGVGVGGEFIETELETELDLIDLNVSSSVHLAKRVSKDMARRGEGRILFTSSIASTMPGPYEAVYAASKAFIESFAQAIRFELKDKGITVTTLLPGPTETEFFVRAGMENTKVGQSKKDDPADVAADGFKALMNGDDHVFGGSLKNNVQGFTAKFMPDTAKARLHADLAKPLDGSSH